MTIQDAINLLEDNGYIIIKHTEKMREDHYNCKFASKCGKEISCLTCSNLICISELQDRDY